MKRTDWTITESSTRPAGKPDECFYCHRKIGEEHAGTCVIRSRTVVCEIKLELVRTVPEDWDEDMINFHMNDSSWCFDNIAEEIADTVERMPDGTCVLCAHAEGRFIREATPEDEAAFRLSVCEAES